MANVRLKLKDGEKETVEVARLGADGKQLFQNGKGVTEKVTRPKFLTLSDTDAKNAVSAKGAIYEYVTEPKDDTPPVAAPVSAGLTAEDVRAIVRDEIEQMTAADEPEKSEEPATKSDPDKSDKKN